MFDERVIKKRTVDTLHSTLYWQCFLTIKWFFLFLLKVSYPKARVHFNILTQVVVYCSILINKPSQPSRGISKKTHPSSRYWSVLQ
jgi:hypothetical protein